MFGLMTSRDRERRERKRETARERKRERETKRKIERENKMIGVLGHDSALVR